MCQICFSNIASLLRLGEAELFPYLIQCYNTTTPILNVLFSLAKDVNPGATVNLEFRHPFVKLVLDVDNQLTGAPAVTGATVSDVYTEANLVLDAGTIVPASAKGVVPATKNANGRLRITPRMVSHFFDPP